MADGGGGGGARPPGPRETAAAAAAAMGIQEERQALVADVAPATAPKGQRKAADFEHWFDWIPAEYREGPWSPVAFAFLAAWPAALAWSSQRMMESYHTELRVNAAPGGWWLGGAAAGLLWTSGWNLYMVRKWSLYPYASFTLVSWSLLTLRFLAVLVAPHSPIAAAVGEVLRFPTLAAATTTTLLWNFVLQFVIYWAMPTPAQRAQFVRFNRQFSLMNIHILNLPLALLSHCCSLRPLVFFDLWVSSAFFYLYALFYLLVLDPLGVHMYPVFTPRTPLCAIPYALLVGLTFAVHAGWARLLPGGTPSP